MAFSRSNMLSKGRPFLRVACTDAFLDIPFIKNIGCCSFSSVALVDDWRVQKSELVKSGQVSGLGGFQQLPLSFGEYRYPFRQQQIRFGFFFQDPATLRPADREAILHEFYEVISDPSIPEAQKDGASVRAKLFTHALNPVAVTEIFRNCHKGRYANWILFGVTGQHVIREKMAIKFTSEQIADTVYHMGCLAKLCGEGKVNRSFWEDRERDERRDYRGKNLDHTPRLKAKRRRYANPEQERREFFHRATAFIAVLVNQLFFNEYRCFTPLSNEKIGEVLYGLGLLFKKDEGMMMNKDISRIMKFLIMRVYESDRHLMNCTFRDIAHCMYGCACVGYNNRKANNRLCGQFARKLRAKHGISYETPYKFTMKSKKKQQEEESESDEDSDEEGDLLVRNMPSKPQPLNEELNEIDELSEVDACNVAWALATLRFPHPYLLEALAIHATANMDSLGCESIASLVRAYGELKFRDEEFLEAVAKECMKPERLNAFSERAFGKLVYGLGKLEYDNEDVLDALNTEIARKERLAKFDHTTLADLVYGYGKLEMDNTTVRIIGKEIVKRGTTANFTEEDLANIVYGFQKLGIMQTQEEEQVA